MTPPDPAPIAVANAPCSWGVIGTEGETPPGAQMLDELAASGYRGTELGDYGYLPTDPAALRRALRARELTLLGAFVGVDLRRPGAAAEARAELVRVAALLAAATATAPAHGNDRARPPWLILADANGRDPLRTRHAGRIGPQHALPADDWRRFSRNAEEAARIVRGETGLPTLFHPHAAGFVETPDETARLLDDTDPELLNLVFDSGHYLYGAGAPAPDANIGEAALRGLERFWERVPYLHFKDLDPAVAARARAQRWDYTTAVRAGLFCELGRGCVDFGAIVALLRARGYHGWITVEQDVLPGRGTPLASARRNRDHLRRLGV